MSISLPLASESVRCNEFARRNEIDPGGTALAPDVLVLVEVPEPWPKPVGKHELLAPLVGLALAHHEQVRLLAAVPHDTANPRTIALRPAVGGMTRSERLLGDDPSGALLAVLGDDDREQISMNDGARRTLLVCTQGSHDVCCGVDGAQFAEAIESTRPDVELFRVSHTGGHRFAPTAMTLPDGRMWAYLTADVADSLFERVGSAASVAPLCRGWWGVPTGPAQMAERAVFAEVGFDLDVEQRLVTVGNDGSHVEVEVGGDVYDVRVGLGRQVPTIACAMPGGQPVKPGREWVVLEGPTKR